MCCLLILDTFPPTQRPRPIRTFQLGLKSRTKSLLVLAALLPCRSTSDGVQDAAASQGVEWNLRREDCHWYHSQICLLHRYTIFRAPTDQGSDYSFRRLETSFIAGSRYPPWVLSLPFPLLLRRSLLLLPLLLGRLFLLLQHLLFFP